MANVGKDGPFPLEGTKSGELISSVDSVDVRWVAMNKVSIIINADGKTTTNGWKNPRLEPVVYVQQPPDGIWDFNFVADRPGAANDVMTPVKATYQWENPPGDAKGVRVAAKTNKKTADIKK
jgi:hypothetical protein